MLPLVPPIVLAADAAPLEPAATTRVALSLDGDVSPTTSTYGAASANSNSSGLRAGGNANVTVYFLKPLVDDAAPLSLQPFLQRTSQLTLSGGGSGIHDDYSPRAGGGTYTQAFTPESISSRTFVTESVALLGSVGVDYLHDTRAPQLAGNMVTRDVWEPWGELGVGLWSGDASLTLQWQVVGVEDAASNQATSWRSVFWPRLSLAGRIVLERRYDLSATVAVLPDGIDVKGSVGYYPTKELGLSLLGGGQHGQIYWDSSTDYDSALGGVAVSYWVVPRVSVALSFTPTWVSWSTGTEWNFPIVLTGTARLP